MQSEGGSEDFSFGHSAQQDNEEKMPKIKNVNHVAVVVDDMEKALSFWRDALGMELHELRDVPAEKSQVAFLPLAGSEVELVTPTTSDCQILGQTRAGDAPHLS